MNTDTLYAGKGGINELLNSGTEGGDKWIPAEVDVSIRPGWFYHADEDDAVKTPEQLFDIYLSSVGRGSNLLLNIPPDRRGLVHEIDAESLMGWKRMLDKAFNNNLALNTLATSEDVRGNDEQYKPTNLTDGDPDTYWATDDGKTEASFIIHLDNETEIRYILLQEYIKLGQRINSFDVDADIGGQWTNVASGTTVGYKRILEIEPVNTSRIKITITGARACPVISNVEIY
jgi:alpha-L-fucosidase